MTDRATATVTTSLSTLDNLLQKLRDIDCTSRLLSLTGRFHCKDHQPALSQIEGLLCQPGSFTYSTTAHHCRPVLLNSTTNPVGDEGLHRILESILIRRADWQETVLQSLDSFPARPHILSIGPLSCIPKLALAARRFPIEKMAPGLVDDAVSSEQWTSSARTPLSDEEIIYPSAAPFQYQRVAVVGMSGRFAKSDDLSALWDLLCAGGNACGPVPQDRFQTSQLTREPKGPFFGNFLNEPGRFDHKFFGISSREAKSMDPQQRILLEVAYDTLASAGYFQRRQTKDNKNIGCYVGVGSTDYEVNVASHDATAFSATGTLRAFVSGKVSHHFGWSGPSNTYDTACSSSAVAIHSACMVSGCPLARAHVSSSPRMLGSPNERVLQRFSGRCQCDYQPCAISEPCIRFIPKSHRTVQSFRRYCRWLLPRRRRWPGSAEAV